MNTNRKIAASFLTRSRRGSRAALDGIASAFRAHTAGEPAANKPPLRFATIYWSNGIKPAHWWAKGSGAAMEFGQSAAPLTPHAQDVVFVSRVCSTNRLSRIPARTRAATPICSPAPG